MTDTTLTNYFLASMEFEKFPDETEIEKEENEEIEDDTNE